MSRGTGRDAQLAGKETTMAVSIKVKPGIPQLMDDTDHPTFETWCKRVDGFLTRYIGVSMDDLEDAPWRRWYDARLRPIRAANRALRRSGGALF